MESGDEILNFPFLAVSEKDTKEWGKIGCFLAKEIAEKIEKISYNHSREGGREGDEEEQEGEMGEIDRGRGGRREAKIMYHIFFKSQDEVIKTTDFPRFD